MFHIQPDSPRNYSPQGNLNLTRSAFTKSCVFVNRTESHINLMLLCPYLDWALFWRNHETFLLINRRRKVIIILGVFDPIAEL